MITRKIEAKYKRWTIEEIKAIINFKINYTENKEKE